jgi:hypothetical protein
MRRAGLRALRSRLLGRSAATWHRTLLLLCAPALGRHRRPLLFDSAAYCLGLPIRLRSAAFGAWLLWWLGRARHELLTLLHSTAPLRLRLRSRAALLLTLLRRWLRLLHLLGWSRRRLPLALLL